MRVNEIEGGIFYVLHEVSAEATAKGQPVTEENITLPLFGLTTRFNLIAGGAVHKTITKKLLQICADLQTTIKGQGVLFVETSEIENAYKRLQESNHPACQKLSELREILSINRQITNELYECVRLAKEKSNGVKFTRETFTSFMQQFYSENSFEIKLDSFEVRLETSASAAPTTEDEIIEERLNTSMSTASNRAVIFERKYHSMLMGIANQFADEKEMPQDFNGLIDKLDSTRNIEGHRGILSIILHFIYEIIYEKILRHQQPEAVLKSWNEYLVSLENIKSSLPQLSQ